MSIIIIANDKGGVGKSLVAQGVLLAAAEKGISPAVVEVESSARLAKIFGDVTTIVPPTHDPDVLYRDPDAIFGVWDSAVAAIAGKENALLDIGANLYKPFLSWAANGGAAILQKHAKITMLGVLTMDRWALAAGLANLEDTVDVLPDARRIAVLNSSIADFIDGDRKIGAALKRAQGGGSPIEQISVDRMTAPLWGHIMNSGRLDRALTDPQVERDLLDVVPEGHEGKVTRSLGVYQSWYRSLIKKMMDVL